MTGALRGYLTLAFSTDGRIQVVENESLFGSEGGPGNRPDILVKSDEAVIAIDAKAYAGEVKQRLMEVKRYTEAAHVSGVVLFLFTSMDPCYSISASDAAGEVRIVSANPKSK